LSKYLTTNFGFLEFYYSSHCRIVRSLNGFRASFESCGMTYVSYTIPDPCTNSGYDRAETVAVNSSA